MPAKRVVVVKNSVRDGDVAGLTQDDVSWGMQKACETWINETIRLTGNVPNVEFRYVTSGRADHYVIGDECYGGVDRDPKSKLFGKHVHYLALAESPGDRIRIANGKVSAGNGNASKKAYTWEPWKKGRDGLLRVLPHELGHNFGLKHATDGNIMGLSGGTSLSKAEADFFLRRYGIWNPAVNNVPTPPTNTATKRIQKGDVIESFTVPFGTLVPNVPELTTLKLKEKVVTTVRYKMFKSAPPLMIRKSETIQFVTLENGEVVKIEDKLTALRFRKGIVTSAKYSK